MHACEICGARSKGADALVRLTEIRRARGQVALTLCRGCLQVRQAAAWSPESTERARILAGLATHELPTHGHYAYFLEDEGALRLVRLRDDWIAAHAE